MPTSFASLDSESEMRQKRNPHRFSRCGKRSNTLELSVSGILAKKFIQRHLGSELRKYPPKEGGFTLPVAVA
jgi:hypothetical protein